MANYGKTALVINCGSSSVKFAILNPEDGHVFLNGLAEALNLPSAKISWRFEGQENKQSADIANADHSKALDYLVNEILSKDKELLASIVACGHRIVQGGDIYSEPTLVTDEVVENIKKVIPFAPLHNPAHILGINAARKSFPNIPHVTVFDTAFHMTMPPKAYRYAIPEKYYTDLHIRKYGAHGTSHMFLAQEAAKLMGKPLEQCNFITCHLGNGASVSAVKGGKCMDTSMGLTPLDGLVMGTRCGSIDPSVIFFLCDRLKMTPEEVKDVFNKESGLKALSGVSSDMRPIEKAYSDKSDDKCVFAFEAFIYRLAKFIASYYIPLGHVDGIVFAGGIGENSEHVRRDACDLLKEPFGVEIDNDKNNEALAFKGAGPSVISKPSSKVTVMMIPTNEELVIARSAMKFVK